MNGAPKQPLSPIAYAIIALVGFIVGIGLLLFYVYQVPQLIEGGIANQVFYVLLLPWGLASAGFLFGTMRSYARLRNKRLGTSIELGGPVVVFCLVVWGGFTLIPQTESFDLTVRLREADDQGKLIAAGKVIVDLDSDRRIGEIDSKGEANFKEIPQKFWGAEIKIHPQVEGYEETSIPVTVKSKSRTIDLELKREQPLSMFTGTVVPAPGLKKQIKLFVDGAKGEGQADDFGRFEFSVKGKEGEAIRLKVYADGQLVYDDYQTLPGPVTLRLRKP